MMFHQALDRFGDNAAIIDAASGTVTSYAALDVMVAERLAALGPGRNLIFLEARNELSSIVDYLAALRGGHVVHMLDDLASAKSRDLVDRYRPNLVIDGTGAIKAANPDGHALHPDCALLLSTSGSTGSPKFVKLSLANIDANAQAIADYLLLDASERALQHLKPHYSYGLSIINSHLAIGAALVLTRQTVLDAAFWEQLRTFGATSFAGVPYTFEMLHQRGFDPADLPSLRSITQAGGKLQPDLVSEFARRSTAAGVRFYVMYGQTEAAPRISYLPPEMAEHNPTSIGKAIPGGTLYLVDGDGVRIEAFGTPGELAYEGPNVMMGYATDPAGLAGDETPPRLLTGDIAQITENGLFQIVGRSSRFVKPFGVRVNLDEVEGYLKARHGTVAVAGDDGRIVVAVETTAREAGVDRASLAERFGMPARMFDVRALAKLPLLDNGKPDYRTLLGGDTAAEERPSLFRRGVAKVMEVLGLNRTAWNSVIDVFRSVLNDPGISPDRSFNDLAADSLSFVTLAVELEGLFEDDLPEDWQEMTIADLEERLRESETI